MVPKFAKNIALIALLNLATSYSVIDANAQSGAANLRGPIGADSLGPESASPPSSPTTPAAQPASADEALGGPVPFINPPAEPAGAAKMPVPQVNSSEGQHTNVGIPLDLPAATQGLLLDTTNPNHKPPKPPEPLTAVITNVEMTTGSREIILGNYRGLQVHVANGTDRPLLFNGDAAVLRLNGTVAKTITDRQLDNTVDPDQTMRDLVIGTIKAGVTIGALPAIKDIQMQRGPVLQRYGGDERRRESEESRFGKRILWPGDSCDGIVFFQTNQGLSGGTIELPVCSLSDTQDRTALTGASNPTGSASLAPVTEGEAQAVPINTLPAAPHPKGRKKERP